MIRTTTYDFKMGVVDVTATKDKNAVFKLGKKKLFELNWEEFNSFAETAREIFGDGAITRNTPQHYVATQEPEMSDEEARAAAMASGGQRMWNPAAFTSDIAGSML